MIVPMTPRAIVLFVLFALPALAKPWQGLEPGVTKKASVTKHLGTPTKASTEKGKEVLLYSGLQAVSGTHQVQVKLDEKGVIERIDVYPAVPLSPQDVEGSYGSWCNADEPTDPCYDKRKSSKGEYWLYQELGLAVFFADRKVEQLVYLPGKKGAAKAKKKADDEDEE